MKFPKLTTPLLTMVISYLPVIIPFLFLLSCVFIFPDGEMNLSRALAIFGPLVFALVFMLKNFGFYLFSEVILLEIRAWQRAREYFESDINGRNLKTAEKIISDRCRFLGKKINPANKNENLILFRLSRRNSSTINWSRFDKSFLIYSVPYLDEKSYAEIINSARANIKAEHKPFKPTIFTDRHQRKAPICKYSVVLILAENISSYIPEKALKSSQNKFDGCLMPCVADMSTGRYYFDSLAETCFAQATPEKNRAISLIKKYVFGGKLPLKNNHRMLPCEIDSEFFEMTLWDLIRFYKKVMKDGKDETSEFINKMKINEVKFDENLVFFKMNKKTAVFMALEDEENKNKVEVSLTVDYDYPSKGRFTISEMNTIRKRISEELNKIGYKVTFDEEALPKSYKKNNKT